MTVDWPRFVDVISSHQRFLLTSHIRPDCDALGSELGMAGVLDALGKDVRIVNGQSSPPNLRFIDPGFRVQALGTDVQPAELEDRELLIILDTSAWAQLGPMADVVRGTKAKKIVVDHHVSGDDLGAELFKNTTAEATGRIVLEAARYLGVEITPQIAMPLFAAIATDTGWFRFGSTTGDTFRFGGQLVDAGASPPAVYNALYEQNTLARLKLIGRILARCQLEMNGRLIYTYALQEDFQATGALPTDTEDVINMALDVGGTQAAFIMVELASGAFKLSFRSRTPRVDCSQLAEIFGGGGHKAAAGASLKEPLETALAKVLDAMRAAMG